MVPLSSLVSPEMAHWKPLFDYLGFHRDSFKYLPFPLCMGHTFCFCVCRFPCFLSSICHLSGLSKLHFSPPQNLYTHWLFAGMTAPTPYLINDSSFLKASITLKSINFFVSVNISSKTVVCGKKTKTHQKATGHFSVPWHHFWSWALSPRAKVGEGKLSFFCGFYSHSRLLWDNEWSVGNFTSPHTATSLLASFVSSSLVRPIPFHYGPIDLCPSLFSLL